MEANLAHIEAMEIDIGIGLPWEHPLDQMERRARAREEAHVEKNIQEVANFTDVGMVTDDLRDFLARDHTIKLLAAIYDFQHDVWRIKSSAEIEGETFTVVDEVLPQMWRHGSAIPTSVHVRLDPLRPQRLPDGG